MSSRPEVTGRRRPEAAGRVKLIQKQEVCELVGVTYGSLFTWMKRGEFPLPIEIGPPGGRSSRIAWIEDEIIDWIARRPRRQPGSRVA